MALVRIAMKDFGRYSMLLGERLPVAVRRGLISGAFGTLPILHDATRTAPAASASGGSGAFNTGYYLRAWKASPLPGDEGAIVYNAAPYAGVIEFGRRPGSPPLGPEAQKSLQGWVRRRLGVRDQAAVVQVARAVAFAIGRRGLAARRVMTNAIPKMSRRVEAELVRELDKELARP